MHPLSHFPFSPLLTLLLLACSVPEDRLLTELDTSQWERICDDATAESADTIYDCGNGEETAPAWTAAICVAENDALYGPTCTAVFADWQACTTWDQDKDLCDPGAPPTACVAITTCRAESTTE